MTLQHLKTSNWDQQRSPGKGLGFSTLAGQTEAGTFQGKKNPVGNFRKKFHVGAKREKKSSDNRLNKQATKQKTKMKKKKKMRSFQSVTPPVLQHP